MKNNNLLAVYKLTISICVIWLHTENFSYNISGTISNAKNIHQILWIIFEFLGRLAVPTYLIISGYSILSKKRDDSYYTDKIKYLLKVIISYMVLRYMLNIFIYQNYFNESLLRSFITISHDFIERFSRVRINWYLTSYLLILCTMLTFKDFIYNNLRKISYINLFILVFYALYFIIHGDDSPSHIFNDNQAHGGIAVMAFILGGTIRNIKIHKYLHVLTIIILLDLFINKRDIDLTNYAETSFPFWIIIASSVYILITKNNFKVRLNVDLNKLALLMYLVHISLFQDVQSLFYKYELMDFLGQYTQYFITLSYVVLSLIVYIIISSNNIFIKNFKK